MINRVIYKQWQPGEIELAERVRYFVKKSFGNENFGSILIAVGIIGFVSLGILTVANAQPATGEITSENEQLVLEFMENGYPSLRSRQSIRRQGLPEIVRLIQHGLQHAPIINGDWLPNAIEKKGSGGWMPVNEYNAYSFNKVTAKRSKDGSITIHFGGDPKADNFLPIVPGWNYLVRMYQPGPEILNGTWTFPDPEAVE